jgi:hypothetical protein
MAISASRMIVDSVALTSGQLSGCSAPSRNWPTP